jgi:hypothetical protein
MDVDGYLKRFFDLELSLPRPGADEFLKAQFSKFGLDDFFAARQHLQTRYDRDQLESMFKHLFDTLDFSYRERERAFTLLSLAIRATPQNNHLHPIMLGCLILLKIKNSKLYRDFVAGRAKSEQVVQYFSSGPQGVEFMKSNYGFVLEAELIGAQTPYREQGDLANQFAQQVADESLDYEIRQRARIIMDVMREKRFNMLYSNIQSVTSKIDLVAGE